MSLADLRAVRLAGQRPASVIVLIGQADVVDGPGMVQVTDASADLRPLLGLPVHVIDVAGDLPLTRRVIEALEAVKVRPLGICGPAGSCGVSPEHETAMEIYRRAVCNS